MEMTPVAPTARAQGMRARFRQATRTLTALAALAGLAVLVSACGAVSADSGVARTPATSATPGRSGAASSPGAGRASKAEAYAQCMRAHGVPDFPDPVNGHITINSAPGSALDPGSPQFREASQACEALAPSGSASAGSR